MIGGAGLMLPLRFLPAKAFANGAVGACDILGCDINLNDPALVKKFVLPVPDALDPSFKYAPVGMGGTPLYRVGVGTSAQVWGLKDTGGGRTDRLSTNIFGYGQGDVYTWPGKTFEVQSGQPNQVQWQNNLNGVSEHLLPVDTTLHWCYSLHGFEDRTIDEDGVPIVVHLHGGHTTFLFDGNPEQFFTPNWRVRGPRFRSRTFMYLNDRPAGNLWYHDHALGITRLNVYAGMAGFYFVRDEEDTGLPDNPLGLPGCFTRHSQAIPIMMTLLKHRYPKTHLAQKKDRQPLPSSLAITWWSTAGLGRWKKSSRAITVCTYLTVRTVGLWRYVSGMFGQALPSWTLPVPRYRFT
jgi:hypothetical protein